MSEFPQPGQRCDEAQPTLRVLRIGVATVQDGGRFGYEAQGVMRAGFADPRHAQQANLSLGNAPDAAVLEVFAGACVLEALAPVELSLSGAWIRATVQLDQTTYSVHSGQVISMRAGARLTIERFERGRVLNIAAPGGWQGPRCLGSQSHDLSLPFDNALRRGTELTCRSSKKPSDWTSLAEAVRQTSLAEAERKTSLQTRCHDHRTGPLRVLSAAPARGVLSAAPARGVLSAAPARGVLSAAPALDALLAQPFTVSTLSHRHALRLCEPLQMKASHANASQRSSAVVPGLIQLPPDGIPIVLGVDAQTVGGYPELAVVARVDLWRLAHFAPNESLSFARIDLASAEVLWQQRRLELERLAVRIQIGN